MAAKKSKKTKDKSLVKKAINIKGKKYVLVSDRIIFFNSNYQNGMIKTKLLSDASADMVVIKAIVYPDVDKKSRYFTGYSQATWGDGMVNKTSALENCETSAVGRALAMMGIGVIESVSSADEMNKALGDPRNKSGYTRKKATVFATDKQKKMIFSLGSDLGSESGDQTKDKVKDFFKLETFNDLTAAQASKVIDSWSKKNKKMVKEESVDEYDVPDEFMPA